jgi:hypothetical protein
VGLLVIEMLTCNNPLRGENRKASEYLTKYKELSLPSSMNEEAQSIALAFLQRDARRRLGSPRDGEDDSTGVRRVRNHRFFAGMDWVKLLSGELPAPFDCKNIELSSTTPQRQLTPETNQLDYFCQALGPGRSPPPTRAPLSSAECPRLATDGRLYEDVDGHARDVGAHARRPAHL